MNTAYITAYHTVTIYVNSTHVFDFTGIQYCYPGYYTCIFVISNYYVEINIDTYSVYLGKVLIYVLRTSPVSTWIWHV